MLHFQERGHGPNAVVALHGFLGSGRNLGALVRQWTARSPDVRIFVPDLLGHGRSPPLPPDATADDLADGVLDWMQEQGLDSARFVGHSLGGRVALLCRAREPQRVARVDLLDITPGPIPPVDTEAVLDALQDAPARAQDRKEIVDFLLSRELSAPLVEWLSMNLEREGHEVGWRIDRERLAAYHARTRSEPLWWTLEPRAGGVRLLRGGRSRYVPEADVKRLGELGVQVSEVPQAGHFIHVDATSQVVDWLVSA